MQRALSRSIIRKYRFRVFISLIAEIWEFIICITMGYIFRNWNIITTIQMKMWTYRW